MLWGVGLPLLLALFGCGKAPSAPSFLLLSIDTLRADHLGCYGYPLDTSPEIDRFARESVRFERALAPTPWTLPSHVAMLSGRHPYDVGIHDYESAVPEEVELLAELLSQAGYETAAFVDSDPAGFVGAERGFARGFGTYAHAPHREAPLYTYDMALTVDAATRWLESRDRSVPFFLFLHTKSVHSTPVPPGAARGSDAPYDKPEPYRIRFLPSKSVRFVWREGRRRGSRYLRALNERIAEGGLDPRTFPREGIRELEGLYDGGIYYVDEQFGRLRAALRSNGLEPSTVIVLTADHGEAFLEHQFFLHKEVYAPLLHVPLILFDPREPPRVVSKTVRITQIVPTLLERAGIPGPPGIDRPLLSDGQREDPAFFSFYRFKPGYYYEAFALEEGPFKLVHHRRASDPDFRTELYDLRTDPGEQRPVSDQEERLRGMLDRLRERIREGEATTGRRIELGPDAIEELRSLGYVE